MYAVHTHRQRDWSDGNAAARMHETIDYRGSPVHELIRDLPLRALVDLLRRHGVSLDGKRVLVVGCGLGTELYYLGRYAAPHLVCTDISRQNAVVTRKFFPGATVTVSDTEALPFADGAFDYVLVCDSLHHMARPFLGLYEMLRTAREGICVIEPHDCLLTRIATRFGLMQEYEEAGNYVLKLGRNDMERLARTFRLKSAATSLFATDFGLFERLPMALRRILFPAFRLATALANTVLPRQGNAFVGVILK